MRAFKNANQGRKLHSTKEVKKIAYLNQIRKDGDGEPDVIFTLANPFFNKLRDLKLCDVMLEVMS